MADNPNEFNDSDFMEVSMNLNSDPDIADYVAAFWKAGATEDDIREEFRSVVDNALMELE